MFAFNNKYRAMAAAFAVTFIFVTVSSPTPSLQTAQNTAPQCGQVNGCGPQAGADIVPNLWFQNACNNHDLCYGDLNKTKVQCDTGFLRDMLAVCNAFYVSKTAHRLCRSLAATYFIAVLRKGGSAYDDGQKNTRNALAGIWLSQNGITLDVTLSSAAGFQGILINSSCTGTESWANEKFFDVTYYTAVPGECRFVGRVHPISYVGMDSCDISSITNGSIYLWGNELEIRPASYPPDFVPLGFVR